ncbi:MAG: hypothetical protein V7752_07165 [Halopseudomonas sp.]
MLYSLDAGKEIKTIPHKKAYIRWRSRLSEADYAAIFEELSDKINNTDIQTSSWIPGANWAGTVFEPIYSEACENDPVAAAKFFGLLLWEVMLNDDSCWAYGRYEKDGIKIDGLTYFTVDSKKLMGL